MGGRLLLAFEVNARPRPKGSLTGHSPKGTTHVRMTESVDPEGHFRLAVGLAACVARYGFAPEVTSYRELRATINRQVGERLSLGAFDGPLETRMLFRFARKPGHGFWAPAEGERPLAVGDIEKLVRNVHDALQDACVIVDDAQVTTLGRVAKRFCDEDAFEAPGALVQIWTDHEMTALDHDGVFYA